MNKMRTKCILLSLSCLLVCACGEKKEQTQNDEAISVVTETVVKDGLSGANTYVGTVEASNSVSVSFGGMGTLKSLNASEGQPVKKGQLIATIDDTQVRAALSGAKASLEQALDAERRMGQLHESGSLPEMQWVDVETKVSAARATYDTRVQQLKDCSVYAPVSGVIGKKSLNVGENVLPSEPVVTILDINEVKVQVSVPEKEIAGISNGMATTIKVDALGGATFNGGRIEKGVSADALTHTYNIYIYLKNPNQQLLPGMVANVHFYGEEGDEAITIPVKAVQQSADKSLFVWTTEGGVAKRVKVELGETVGNRVVISGGGLHEGQKVVVEGYQKLSEGSKVR